MAAVEHGIGRFVFYWLIQVESCLGFGRRLAVLFWSGGAWTLNCRLCPHDGDIMGVARGSGAYKPSPWRMG